MTAYGDPWHWPPDHDGARKHDADKPAADHALTSNLDLPMGPIRILSAAQLDRQIRRDHAVREKERDFSLHMYMIAVGGAAAVVSKS